MKVITQYFLNIKINDSTLYNLLRVNSEKIADELKAKALIDELEYKLSKKR